MEELSAKLSEYYGLNVFDSQEVGSRSELTTDHGPYYLYNCPAAYRLKGKFIEQVEELLDKQQKVQLLPTAKTLQEEEYFLHGNKMYYVKQGMRKHTPSNEAYLTGNALARFHLATASYKDEKMFRSHGSFGSWPSMWRQKIRQLDDYRDQLDDQVEDISLLDEYLLTTYTYVRQLGDTAVQYLTDAGYQRMLKGAGKYGKIAYQNFDEGYVLFDENGNPLLAGEWSWVIDMRSRDIAQWIKSDVRRNGWDEGKILAFLEGYTDVSLLADEEYACMYALLLYPGRFLKLMEAYKHVSAEEQERLEDWEEKLDGELLSMEQALYHFPSLVSNRYGVALPTLEWSFLRFS
ncbi:MAG: hypothetical protein ACM32O_08025 [Clostridia bacterium]